MIRDWQAAGRFFQHKGHSVFHRDDGVANGEVVVCMHGFPTSSWDWHRLWPQLRAQWRVIAPDMLGYGFSDKPADYDYSVMDHADTYEELFAFLEIDRVHLLAHDLGDTVALELMARQNRRIASVCLLNGGLFPETHRPTITQRLLAGPLGFLVGRLMNEKKFARALSVIFGPDTKPSAEELGELWMLVAFNAGHRVAHKHLRYIRERRKYRDRWVGALHTKIPLRVINGAADPISGAHMIARLREEIPNADVVSLPDIGHYPQLEDPLRVFRAYADFRLP